VHTKLQADPFFLMFFVMPKVINIRRTVKKLETILVLEGKKREKKERKKERKTLHRPNRTKPNLTLTLHRPNRTKPCTALIEQNLT
jgi:hypothetical protein